jgi:peptidyl-prolyl cis-trans isomerase C
MTLTKIILSCIVTVQFMGVSACSSGLNIGSDPISGTQTAEALLPSATPSATPIPMAFTLNGAGYPLTKYERELQRYQIVKESAGQNQDTEIPETYVLDNLIDQQLLIQAAEQNACTVADADVQQQWEKLVSGLEQGQTIDAWLDSKGFTEEELRSAIHDSVLESCQIKIIADAVPNEVEQIRASQIVVSDRNLADAIYNQLESGAEFATLAYEYDSLTGGDLGWFPQGYLLQPAVDEAVFAMQSGQFTGVIESEIGFHIVYIYKREVHPLALDARKVVQEEALKEWLTAEREKAQLTVSLPD